MNETGIKVLKATPVRSFLRSISAEELSNISPEEWLIDDFLPSGPRVCLLIGNSNVGKSFLALDVQNSLVCGFREWHGKKINRNGAVLYLTGRRDIRSEASPCMATRQEHTTVKNRREIRYSGH